MPRCCNFVPFTNSTSEHHGWSSQSIFPSGQWDSRIAAIAIHVKKRNLEPFQKLWYRIWALRQIGNNKVSAIKENETITLCWVSDCGGKKSRESGCHGETNFRQFSSEKNAWTISQLLSSLSQRFHGFIGHASCILMHCVWKSGNVKKRPVWNCISLWTGLNRTLKANFKVISQVHSYDPVTTCLQNIQPDHTIYIWINWSNMNRLKDTVVLFILSFLSSIIRPTAVGSAHHTVQ